MQRINGDTRTDRASWPCSNAGNTASPENENFMASQLGNIAREGSGARLNSKQYAAFIADKKRLDWLEEKRGDVQFAAGAFRAGHPGMTRSEASTVREAIDRAMQREP